MFGPNSIYFNGSLRKYVIYFGSLFNDIWIGRDSTDGEVRQTMRVPLNYGSQEKFLGRAEGNPDLDRPIAIQLPRMSFEMTGIVYDASRKLGSVGKIVGEDPSDPNKRRFFYNPVPYNISFELYIMTKSVEDGTRIIEQILPNFTPEWTATLNMLPDIDAKYDIPVILNGVDNIDTYEGSFIDRRLIVWTLRFTMKALLFGPMRSSSIIKQAEISFRNPNPSIPMDDANPNNSPVIEMLTITPGLLPNGSPTTNAAASIDKNLIKSTDNYDYIIDIDGDT